MHGHEHEQMKIAHSKFTVTSVHLNTHTFISYGQLSVLGHAVAEICWHSRHSLTLAVSTAKSYIFSQSNRTFSYCYQISNAAVGKQNNFWHCLCVAIVLGENKGNKYAGPTLLQAVNSIFKKFNLFITIDSWYMRTNPLAVHAQFFFPRTETISFANHNNNTQRERRKVQTISQPVDHSAWLFRTKPSWSIVQYPLNIHALRCVYSVHTQHTQPHGSGIVNFMCDSLLFSWRNS